VGGSGVVSNVVTVVLLVQFFVVYALCLVTMRRLLLTFVFVVCGVVAWFFEFLGSVFGFPFGSYDYTDNLLPQFMGVPLLIPLAWFMMLPAAWVVADLLVPKQRVYSFAMYVLVSALAITAWDLFLDPLMVSWEFWFWETPEIYSSTYFGIPWVNYAGWILTGAVITALVRPWRFVLPREPLLVIYSLTWLLQSAGLAVFWALAGPALVGSFGMGIFVYLAVRNYLRFYLSLEWGRSFLRSSVQTVHVHD
jgi:putative membrane protein